MATLIACSAYILIFISIGLVAHRKYTSAEEFMLGGRSMNFWVTALGAHASDMSSWLFMGFPAAIFALGLGQAWIAFGLCAGMFCNWHFVAPKLRTDTEKYDTYTLSTYFERRFGDTTGWIGAVSAAMILIFLVHYLSAGLIGMGFLLDSLFGINYHIGITLAMIAVMGNCFYGGYVAVAWTDLFQGVFLLVMVILVPSLILTETPWQAVKATAALQDISLSIMPPGGAKGLATTILVALAWGLGYFGSPHILVKFMGINDVKEMRKSKYVGMTWQVLALGSAAMVGVIGIGYFRDGLANPELVFVTMVKESFSEGIAAFVLCAILAAIISTMDTQILVLSAVLTEDFYVKLWRKKASDKELLWVSRLSVAVVCLAALILALPADVTIRDTVAYSWMGLGASFGPPVLCALYYPRACPMGVMCGILVGGLTTGLSHWFSLEIAGVAIPAMIPGFTLNLLAIVMFSRLKRSAQNRPFP